MIVAWTWRLDILKSISGFPMSKQSKNRSSNTPGDGTSSRQPKLLAVMVVVGGAVSTWCWYRPLPKDATNVANGLVSVASGGDSPSKGESTVRSLWGLEGLVFPSLFSKSNPEKKARGGADYPGITGGSGVTDLPGDLVGEQELQLTPYQRLDVPLTERVAGEPLPIIPVQPPLHRGPPAKPPIWVDADDLSGNRQDIVARQAVEESTPASVSKLATNSASSRATNSEDLDAPSPFRIPPRAASPTAPTPVLAESRKWPDEGFQPSQVGTSFRPDKGQFASGNKSGAVGSRSLATQGRDPSAQGVDPSFHAHTNANERDRVMALSSNRIRTKEIEELEPPRDHRQAPGAGTQPMQVRIPDPSNVIRQPRTPSGSGR